MIFSLGFVCDRGGDPGASISIKGHWQNSSLGSQPASPLAQSTRGMGLLAALGILGSRTSSSHRWGCYLSPHSVLPLLGIMPSLLVPCSSLLLSVALSVLYIGYIGLHLCDPIHQWLCLFMACLPLPAPSTIRAGSIYCLTSPQGLEKFLAWSRPLIDIAEWMMFGKSCFKQLNGLIYHRTFQNP